MNTASRLQSVAPSGTVLVGEATHQATSEAIAYEPAGERLLKGKAAPVPAWRALRVVARVRGVGRARGPRGAVRGPRGTSAGAQGLAARHRARPAAAVRHQSRDRQAPARAGWPGSSTSTSTAWSRTSSGTRVARRRTARGSRSGPSARWSASAPGWPRATTTRPPGPASPRRCWSTCQMSPNDAGSSPSCSRCWASRRSGRSNARSCSGPGGRSSSTSATWASRSSCSRTCNGPTHGLIDFIDHLAEWSVTHPIMLVALARPEFLERQRSWGAGGGTSWPCRSIRCPTTRWGTCWQAWSPDCRAPRGRRSWGARRASRCTPSRPSASCSWTGD